MNVQPNHGLQTIKSTKKEINRGMPGASSSIQSLSHVQLFATPWTAACQASLSITNSQSLFKFMSIEPVMPSNYLILCHPFSSCLQSFPASGSFPSESVFASGGQSIGSFRCSIRPSNEYSGLISFSMDWLDLLAVQGTLKSLLQHHNSKASILQHSAFFMVQLLHPYMTTGKTIALTRWTFVGKVTSLLFNILSRLIIAFLPRSKCLLSSWLQSPSAVISEPKKIVSYCFHYFSIYCHEVMGLDAMILVFWMLSFNPTVSLSSFTFMKRLFSSSLLCRKGTAICISEVIDIFPEIFIPAYASSSTAFCILYSAYKLNRQGDNIQPWMYSFLNLEPVCSSMSGSNLLLDLHTDFSGGRSGGLGIPISWRIFHSLLWSTPSKALAESIKQKSKNWCFSGTLLLFQWSSGCWQFDLWFLCLF